MAFSSIAARRFLSDAFSDDELVTFCFDFFSEVEKDFSTGMSKGEKIQKLLEYCQQHEGVEALFKALQENQPEQYLQRFGNLPPPRQFEATFTPGDSSSGAEITINSLSEITDRRIAFQNEQIQYYRKWAIGLVVAGVIVVAGAAAPVKLPIALAVRLMIAVVGFISISLSGLQYRAIIQHEEQIGVCTILRSYLEVLKKQPLLDDETRAQITYWMNQAFEGVMKAKPI